MGRTWIAITVGTVSLVGIVAAYFVMAGGRNEALYVTPVTYVTPGKCVACHRQAELTWNGGQAGPFECPNCAARALLPFHFCGGCKKRFLPPMTRNEAGEPQAPAKLACPGCGHADPVPFEPQNAEHKPTGDIPPPRWPPA